VAGAGAAKSNDMIALMLFGAALEFQLAGGIGSERYPVGGTTAAMLQARVGVDFAHHLTLGATLLGVPGSDCNPCYFLKGSGNAAFKAISGFISLRFHTSGDLQAFIDVEGGIGHLIILSPDDLFEHTQYRGRGGPAWMLGIGGRWFFAHTLAVELELAATQWSNVSHPAYASYASPPLLPEESGLTAGAVMLLLGLVFSPFR
jgi:hypothetical protein